MFKTLFACVLLFHGIFHLLGFAKAFGVFRLDQIKKNISRFHGLLWLAVGLMFIICFFIFLWGEEWWKLPVIAALLSQLLIFRYWQDTKYATPLNILIIVVSIMAFSTWSFNRDIEDRIKSENTRSAKHEKLAYHI